MRLEVCNLEIYNKLNWERYFFFLKLLISMLVVNGLQTLIYMKE